MKRKGYLLIELLLYLSLVSFLIIFVMNLSLFMNKVYKKELKNKDKKIALVDFDLHFDGALKSREIVDIKIFHTTIDVYYKKDKMILRDRFSIKDKIIYRRLYKHTLDGALFFVGEEKTLIEYVKNFEAEEKNNLIYITIEFEDGEMENLVYEK